MTGGWPWRDITGLFRGERTLLWRSDACDHLPLGRQLTDALHVHESGQHPEVYFSLVYPTSGLSIIPAVPFSPQHTKDAFTPFYYTCLPAILLLTKAPLAFPQSVSRGTQFFRKHRLVYSLSGFSMHQLKKSQNSPQACFTRPLLAYRTSSWGLPRTPSFGWKQVTPGVCLVSTAPAGFQPAFPVVRTMPGADWTLYTAPFGFHHLGFHHLPHLAIVLQQNWKGNSRTHWRKKLCPKGLES